MLAHGMADWDCKSTSHAHTVDSTLEIHVTCMPSRDIWEKGIMKPQTRLWLKSTANGAGMHARLLLRASFRSSAHPACFGGTTAETRLQQRAAISATATSASGTGGGNRSSSNNRNYILYPAAAVVALTSVVAVKAYQQPLVVEGQHQHSSLLDAHWVQQIPQQQNVLQVLSAKSIETHPLLTRDHIVRSAQFAGDFCERLQ